jgi:hypothetical protein
LRVVLSGALIAFLGALPLTTAAVAVVSSERD